MTTLNYTATVIITNCCTCGGPVALTDSQERALRKSHASFYCAIGHPMSFTAKSDADKLADAQREIVAARARLDQEKARAAAEAKRADEAERKTARVKKRAISGTCPCCKRSFAQLRQHMRSKHPEVALTNDVRARSEP